MAGEQSPDQNPDSYAYPPLHPNHDPKEIAGKIAVKRTRIIEAAEAFSKRQSERANQEAEASREKRQRHTHGYMTGSGSDSKLVERTPSNRHLFQNGRTGKELKLASQGSGIVVGLLQMHEQANSPDFEYNCGQRALFTVQRQLALIDRDGNFYDGLSIDHLDPPDTESGTPGIKHTVVFRTMEDQGRGTLSMPIDDIYCFSLARPPEEPTNI